MQSRRAHTLKDVADRVGVGPATVSVVLNGSRSGTRVSDKTRDAILAAANELNYRPNALARSLRKRRTGIVGFYSGYNFVDARNPFIAEVLAGMQEACIEGRMDLLLFSPHTGHTPADIVATLADGRLDGLVVTAREDHPIVPELRASHLPVVAIADALDAVPSVVADAEAGGRLQARTLRELGHVRVLYRPATYPFPSVVERQRAFLREAETLGIRVEVGRPVDGYVAPGVVPQSLSSEEFGLFRGVDRATAAVCWDDGPAYWTCADLEAAGLGVPSDVSVFGYNGLKPVIPPRWELSTVGADWAAVGASAIRALSRLIEGANDVPAVQRLPIHLVPGATLAPPRL